MPHKTAIWVGRILTERLVHQDRRNFRRPSYGLDLGAYYREEGRLVDWPARREHRGWLTGRPAPNYLGVSPWFASSCTDFVVADLSIVDFVDRPHAAED